MRARARAEGGSARCTLTDIDPDVVVRGVSIALSVHSRMSAERRRELPRGTPAPLPAFDESVGKSPLLIDRDAGYYTRPDHPADAADARPLADRLERFVRLTYDRVCTEPEVPIIALVLIERLVRVVGVGFVRRQSVRPLVASAFVLACKIWFDDLTHIIDFCELVCGGDRTWLQRLATCELELLSHIGFDVTVRPRAFATYYFAMLSSIREEQGQPGGGGGGGASKGGGVSTKASGALPGMGGGPPLPPGAKSASKAVSGVHEYRPAAHTAAGRAEEGAANAAAAASRRAVSGTWEYSSTELKMMQRVSLAASINQKSGEDEEDDSGDDDAPPAVIAISGEEVEQPEGGEKRAPTLALPPGAVVDAETTPSVAQLAAAAADVAGGGPQAKRNARAQAKAIKMKSAEWASAGNPKLHELAQVALLEGANDG